MHCLKLFLIQFEIDVAYPKLYFANLSLFEYSQESRLIFTKTVPKHSSLALRMFTFHNILPQQMVPFSCINKLSHYLDISHTSLTTTIKL